MRIRENGITLIALVVTIVVLLILAGVSISMLTGENGIIKQAQNSKEQSEIGDEKEAIMLAYNGVILENNGSTELTAEKLKQELIKNGRTDIKNVTGDNPITIEFNSGRKYDIDNTGDIVENNKTTGDESWYTYEDVENGIRITGFNSEITELRMQILQELQEITENNELTEEEFLEMIFEYLESKSGEIEVKYPGIGNVPSQIDGKNVTEIGVNAFSFFPVQELTIPNTVTIIGNWAFMYGGAKEVAIPNSVKSVGAGAFQVSLLEKITFNGDIEIGVRAFNDCSYLEKVIFRSSNITFGEKIDDGTIGIFLGCPKLVDNTIQIPQGTRQNFEKSTLKQWGLSSYDVFYEE